MEQLSKNSSSEIKGKMADVNRHLCIVAFFIIILLPTIFGIVEKLFPVTLDQELLGYTDTAEEPVLSAKAFSDGSFQMGLTGYYDQNMTPRGVMTKAYNSIRYHCFNLGLPGDIIGKDKDIYSPSYVYSYLNMDEYDFSNPENAEKMNDYLNDLEEINRKLNEKGKKLYVYVAPGKTYANGDNLPESYKAMHRDGSVNGTEMFRAGLSPEIKSFFTMDIIEELEYPPFYTTGIHWSRTFEQKANQKALSDLSQLTGKNYRSIVLGDVNENKEGFWRDNDVFDLLNVWGRPDITYYEYDTSVMYPDEFEYEKVLLMGDSFSIGLQDTFINYLPGSTYYYISYDDYLSDLDNNIVKFDGDFSSVDLKYYLDRVDVVVFQMMEPHIGIMSSGFADYLNDYLDTYQPEEPYIVYDENMDAVTTGEWDGNYASGVYRATSGYSWTAPSFNLTLGDTQISETGLEMYYEIVPYTVSDGKTHDIKIYINGKLIKEESHSETGYYTLIIPPEELPEAENSVYNITVTNSSYFVPCELWESVDDHQYSLALMYVGRVR